MQTITDVLEENLVADLQQIETADLVIGIPSYNNADVIEHVARTVHQGVIRYFPDQRVLILNSDGGSDDGTGTVFLNALRSEENTSVYAASAGYRGIAGKGSAVRSIFLAMQMLGAKAGVMVDSDLRSITPAWVQWLLDPVLEKGQDFVTPAYRRHKHDGTITNMAVYPLTSALYGQRVRQPIGGDFAFSASLVQRYLEDPVWETDVARFGIDIWMTTLAVAEGYRVCQTHMGAKIHDAKDPGESLGPMFKQVLGTLFALMGRYQTQWQAAKEVRDIPAFGSPLEVMPPAIEVSVPRLIEQFKAGFSERESMLSQTLAKENFNDLKSLLQQTNPLAFEFPTDLWVKLLFDVAVAYQRPKVDQQALIEALVPVYMGRTAAFVVSAQDCDNDGAEALVQAQGRRFMELKPYLIERWQQAPELSV